ncbi:MAG: OadG family protein [Cytophagaceae bacterium]
MRDLGLLGYTIVFLFLIFLITLVVGIIKKKPIWFIISVSSFLLGVGMSIWSIYMLVNKAYDKFSTMFEERSGLEVYESMFDKVNENYVEILDHTDRMVSAFDTVSTLHLKIYPKELKRILESKKFSSSKVSTKDWNMKDYGIEYEVESFGDSAWLFIYTDDAGYVHSIYSSLDSTEAFVKKVREL